MRVQMPFRMLFAIGRTLVETHGVRERSIEDAIVATSHLAQNFGEGVTLFGIESSDIPEMALAGYKSFERPDRPERHYHLEMFVGQNQSLRVFCFIRCVFTEQTLMMLVCVPLHGSLFFLRLVRNRTGRPDLTMRMGIAGAHRRTAILEDLNIVNVVSYSEIAELIGPDINHASSLGQSHAGKGQVVSRREADYAANSRFRLGDDQI